MSHNNKKLVISLNQIINNKKRKKNSSDSSESFDRSDNGTDKKNKTSDLSQQKFDKLINKLSGSNALADVSESDISDKSEDSDISDNPESSDDSSCSSTELIVNKDIDNNFNINDIHEISNILENEIWYHDLSSDQQKKYESKLKLLLSPTENIPSIQNIIDLPKNIGQDHIKLLLDERIKLNAVDKISQSYNLMCKNFLKIYNFYTNINNKNKYNHLRDTELAILSNPQFSESMRDRILTSPYPIEIKSIIYETYLSSDSKKRKKWLDTVLGLPNSPKNILSDNLNISNLIKNIMFQLDCQVYGMSEMKEEFICFIANILANPTSKNKAIGMCGPPGVGKTMIAKIVASTIGLPFEQISLGGMTDASFLEGHGYTYIGSEPGRIVKAITNMKYTNGIIFLDEIDKISKTNHGKEIEHALLHIVDFTQNHDFRDKYIPEIPINLSNYIFIYSMNSTHDVDTALLSRIPTVNVLGYTKKEKIEILSKHILQEILKNYSFDNQDIILPINVAEYLINIVPEEEERDGKSGVRGLKKAINRIISRINLFKLASTDGKFDFKLSFNLPNFVIPFTLTIEIINDILLPNFGKNTHNCMYI